jgi:hypothetical protein
VINSKGLVAAHTRMMLPLEECLARMLSEANNNFDNMSESQIAFYEEKAKEWDKMNSDRNTAKLVDAGKMTLNEFNIIKTRK